MGKSDKTERNNFWIFATRFIVLYGVDEKEFSDISSFLEFFGITPKYFRDPERTMFKYSENIRKFEKALNRFFSV